MSRILPLASSPVPIDLSRAPGARLTFNNLVSNPSSADRDQNLVLVELPDDRFIEVSCYPENRNPGAYYVTAFRHGDWDNPLESAEVGTAREAAATVETMAERLTGAQGAGNQGSITTRERPR